MADISNIYMVAYDHRTNDLAAKSPFKSYHVGKTSPFFENAYIVDLINKGAHTCGEWFGVLSPEFFGKALNGQVTAVNLSKEIDKGIKRRVGRNIFEHRELDAMGFHPRLRNKNIILQGDRYHHPKFSEVTQTIFREAGVAWDVRDRLPQVVMSNYIITRPEIYEDYVKTILGPCIEVMNTHEGVREIIWQDSGYHKKKRMRQQLKDDLTVPYYPLHTFICERFWSVYLAMNPQINFRHYGQAAN